MIFVGLGSNLPTERLLSSEQILEESIKSMEKKEIIIESVSSWFRSAPVPPSDQPWFVNGVARLRSAPPPRQLLDILQGIEAEHGRERSLRNASRTLDLDLLAYDDEIVQTPELTLPHPRLAERAFVLLPLAEVAPHWRHPTTGLTAAEMLAKLPPGQQVERLG